MTIDNLIEKYQKAQEEKEAAQKKQKDELIAVRRVDFQDAAKKVLGEELWAALMPQGTEHFFTSNDNQLNLSISVRYGNAHGKIKQAFRIRESKWDQMTLDFGTQFDGKRNWSLYVELPATDESLGRLFADLKICNDYADQEKLARLQRELADALDFSRTREDEIVNKLNRSLDEFPKHADKIRENFSIRRKELEVIAEKKLQNQLAYDLAQSERDQLEALAEFAWRGPLKVYKVRYGARMVNNDYEENDVYTDHLYTMMTEDEAGMPHNNGYYTVFDNGKYERRIKPKHVISTEIVTITKKEDAPGELHRSVTLQSKILEDVSRYTFLPPHELFKFDYDELRVAMEAEQESEIADASQEDNS